jgi:hypothetical protein
MLTGTNIARHTALTGQTISNLVKELRPWAQSSPAR